MTLNVLRFILSQVKVIVLLGFVHWCSIWLSVFRKKQYATAYS